MYGASTETSRNPVRKHFTSGTELIAPKLTRTRKLDYELDSDAFEGDDSGRSASEPAGRSADACDPSLPHESSAGESGRRPCVHLLRVYRSHGGSRCHRECA